MRNPITQSNEWYDKLSDGKRELFFLIFIFGSLLVVQYLAYIENFIWGLPIWMIVWTLWRVPYIFKKCRK